MRAQQFDTGRRLLRHRKAVMSHGSVGTSSNHSTGRSSGVELARSRASSVVRKYRATMGWFREEAEGLTTKGRRCLGSRCLNTSCETVTRALATPGSGQCIACRQRQGVSREHRESIEREVMGRSRRAS